MGMRATIAKAINSAFKAVGDIAVPMVYHSYGQSPTVRDPDTGLYSRPVTLYPALGIYTDIKILEGRANVPDAEKVILMRRSEVPAYNIGDNIVDGSNTYEVLVNVTDPTEQLWQFAVREKKPVVNV